MNFDVAVIGSGFGGSVCAARAAQAGLRVVVLERGPRMDDDAYRRLAEGRMPFLAGGDQPGPIEWHRLKGLRAFTGNCVGGGSHLYTAVTIRARPEIFDERWPAALGGAALEPYYARVEAMIAPRPVPIPPTRARAVCEIAGRLGGRGVILPLAMEFSGARGESPVTLRGKAVEWIRGGRETRKKTLDQSYLATAQAAGAMVLPLHEVEQIETARGGYRLLARDTIFSARQVVIAAGTLGTLRLLLNAHSTTLPKLSSTLGSGFFTNGDFGALLVGPRCALKPDAGPPVTAWLDWWKEDRLYLMETNHFLGGHVWSFGVMGFDDSPGRIESDSGGGLRHVHDPRRAETFHEARLKRLRELAAACGAKLLHLPGGTALRRPYTVHPLGGAAISDSPERGVVNADGEVHGYPGLYIADGSTLPTPIGCAPSMTIAALAERISDHLISHA